MCGRYVLTEDHTGVYPKFFLWKEFSSETWDQLFEEDRVVEVEKSYNIAPTQCALIVINRDGTRELKLARWSCTPPWWDIAKNDGKYPKFAIFDARDDKFEYTRVATRTN